MNFSFSTDYYVKYIILNIEVDEFCCEYGSDKYAFIFKINENPESTSYRRVEVELVLQKRLLLFNENVQKAEKVSYKGGRITLHDLIEIVEDKSEFQTSYIAKFKKQPIKHSSTGEIMCQGDRNFLLFSTCKGKDFQVTHNVPLVQMAPKFKAAVECWRTESLAKEAEDAKSFIEHVAANTRLEEEKELLSNAAKLLEGICVERRKENYKAFDIYLSWKHDRI